jgi:hypothetical protein
MATHWYLSLVVLLPMLGYGIVGTMALRLIWKQACKEIERNRTQNSDKKVNHALVVGVLILFYCLCKLNFREVNFIAAFCGSLFEAIKFVLEHPFFDRFYGCFYLWAIFLNIIVVVVVVLSWCAILVRVEDTLAEGGVRHKKTLKFLQWFIAIKWSIEVPLVIASGLLFALPHGSHILTIIGAAFGCSIVAEDALCAIGMLFFTLCYDRCVWKHNCNQASRTSVGNAIMREKVSQKIGVDT